ncbi:hypothetical protein [Natranaerobius trueperi]|uniref:Uncharacterized protein n=1 Tax=Natranaerobius trueperi TaxID=759412 RepID=A0A226C2H2_9FIRM|nr:hypothetical protein [Natranaerobius trueperi]OWZ84814.1 hypothetical protein CDO51_02010 [Natranaerobius trueperi]
MYHEVNSEVVTGKASSNGYREKVYLSTKLPVAKMESEHEFNIFLEDQLEKHKLIILISICYMF